jgi:hypothetical protein
VADLGFLEAEIKTLPEALRPPMLRIVRAIVKDIRFGHPTGDERDPLLNLGGAFLHGTTPTTPGEEFTIAHSFGRTPYLALMAMRLSDVGSSIVPLTVSRAADANRIYLTSTIGDAPITLVVEG